mmetsp:Transcript_21792/g.73879  ORF Transcript_21792/g.73879 Transcript_21792/m.73879 type:complete len:201 (-) Transcript_21792:162-764(-)
MEPFSASGLLPSLLRFAAAWFSTYCAMPSVAVAPTSVDDGMALDNDAAPAHERGDPLSFEVLFRRAAALFSTYWVMPSVAVAPTSRLTAIGATLAPASPQESGEPLSLENLFRCASCAFSRYCAMPSVAVFPTSAEAVRPIVCAFGNLPNMVRASFSRGGSLAKIEVAARFRDSCFRRCSRPNRYAACASAREAAPSLSL